TFPRGDWKIDESTVDKNGTVVLIDAAVDNPGYKLWDFRTDAVTALSFLGTERAGGHADMGRGHMVNGDVYASGICLRDLDNPTVPRNIFRFLRADGTVNWSFGAHVSMRTDDERFVVGSTYLGDGKWDAFEDEIYLAFTDGSKFVRLAHTRSTTP